MVSCQVVIMKNLRSCLCVLILFPFLLVTLKKAFFSLTQYHYLIFAKFRWGYLRPLGLEVFAICYFSSPPSKYLSLKNFKMPSTTV